MRASQGCSTDSATSSNAGTRRTWSASLPYPSVAAIGAAAQAIVLGRHTYDHRAADIVARMRAALVGDSAARRGIAASACGNRAANTAHPTGEPCEPLAIDPPATKCY
jgi:hypothetical protein